MRIRHLLIPAAAALAGCGGGDAEARREVAELRAAVASRTAESEALSRRVKELEARSRALEEQVGSLGLRPGGGAAVPATANADAPASPGAPDAAPPAPPPGTGEVASYLDSDAGKQKLREFLAAEERAKEQRAQQAMREQMETGIRDRVTGYLTEQLGLDRRQQDALVSIALDTMDRMGEVWRGARDAGNDPSFLANARDKTGQIRQEALDRVAQALTAEQFTKFQEIQPGGGGLLGGRGMGAAPGGPGGFGGFGGRAPRPPGGDSGGGAPSPPR